MTTPPSGSSSGSSSYTSDATLNEVPEEYLITSTSSLPPLSTEAFPFPPQHPSSSMPTTKPPNLPWIPQQQQHFPPQPPQPPPPPPPPPTTTTTTTTTTTKATSSGPSCSTKPNHASSSTAHLLHEQRLSTCLNILRHIQRTLHQRHDEATTHLTQLSGLIAQSTWDLFHQRPLDFMCHEMDMLANDATTTAILTDKSPVGTGSSSSSSSSSRNLSTSQQESDAWMRKLDKLRDLRDDEDEARQRVDALSRQMETANAMMRVGMAEQSAVLARSDALVRKGYHHYRYRYESGFGQLPTMRVPVALALSSRNADVKMTAGASTMAAAAQVPKSSFFNWPVPATSSKGKQVAVESEEEEESSGTSSGMDSPRECQGECCRHFSS
ncbi:hypothetical protein MKX07_007436 [Trichoderma sp. CBMAI-0711]|nr:hypothetical protein MKX07_007436 [Trichoderma sp. CBMAI-0711]